MREIKNLIACVAIACCITSTFAQPVFDWVNTTGSTGVDEGQDIVVDASGNSYVIGRFLGTVDFDPGVGTTNLTSMGSTDVFVQKLDSDGNLIWVKQFGGTGAVIRPVSIARDGNGDLVITGHFQGTVDFDPGPGTSTLSATGSYYDTFIVKLDAAGNFIWVKRLDATHHCYAIDMKVNSSNEVILAGRWFQTADFDPGAGTSNLTAVGTGWDTYILKLSSAGNFVWVKQITCTENMYTQTIAVDQTDNVLVSGYYYGTIDVDPGPGTVSFTGSLIQEEMYILKLDNSGNYVWGKNYTSSLTEMVYGIHADANNDYYFGGWFSTSMDFDAGPGTATLTPVGGSDCFLLKLNSSGAFQWVKQIGGLGTDEITSVTGDSNGDIILAGRFNATVDFNPGAGVDNFTSAGSSDIFVQKESPSGGYFWTVTMGGAGNEFLNAIAAGSNGEILSTGYFSGTADFEPGPGVYNAASQGSNDAFVHKLLECAHSSSSLSPSSCASFTSPSGLYNWTVSGTYSDTIPNASGCDSVITVNLTILQPSTGTDIVSACSSYTWIDGNTYFASNNTATHTLSNSVGCDSVVTLNLTILQPSTGTDIVSACSSYTWIDGNTYFASNSTATHTLSNSVGCDSMVTLNLTILQPSTGTDVVSACSSYTWIDGNTYFASNNTASFTLTNAAGCDSIVTLSLTISSNSSSTFVHSACSSYTWIDGNTYFASNNTATYTLTNAAGCDSVVTLNLTIDTVDPTTTASNDSITSNAAGASYQWLDCNNNFAPIPGETGQTFVVTASGIYAVQVTQGICTDTSACVNVTVIGIEEIQENLQIAVFPNPTSGSLAIRSSGDNLCRIEVLDVRSKLVHSEDFAPELSKHTVLDLPEGTYFLKVYTVEGRMRVFKIIKI